jgi:hypothetical protein
MGLSQSLTKMSTRNLPWGLKLGQRVRLTTSLPSVSQACRPPGPVTAIALFFYYDCLLYKLTSFFEAYALLKKEASLPHPVLHVSLPHALF